LANDFIDQIDFLNTCLNSFKIILRAIFFNLIIIFLFSLYTFFFLFLYIFFLFYILSLFSLLQII